jgi:hypothetical protein
LVGAGNDLDERAFARAVFAEEGVDLARLQIEVDAAERTGAAEGFRQLAKGKQR